MHGQAPAYVRHHVGLFGVCLCATEGIGDGPAACVATVQGSRAVRASLVVLRESVSEDALQERIAEELWEERTTECPCARRGLHCDTWVRFYLCLCERSSLTI